MNVAGSPEYFSRFFGCVFLVLALQGVTVCQDDTCATTDVERAEVGQQLQIHCETECTVDVEWGQLNSDEPVNRNGRNLIVQNILDDSIGGRVYWCQCRGGDRECHLILVDPYIFDFAVEPVVVAVGQRFNLTCRAGGYPHPEHPDFHLAKYIPVSNMSIFNHTIPVQSGVLAIVQDVSVEYSGNYTCVVNTQYLHTDGRHINMHTTNSTAMVTVYDPPKLRGVRNFTTFNAVSEDTEHESAILECIIEETLTAGVVLEWRRNGALLQNSLKYVLLAPLSVDNSNLLVYMLVVRELAPSDMGAYECWLYSNYSFQQNRPENVLQVWILESGGTFVTSEPTTEGIKECNCSNSLCVVAAVLGGAVLLFLLAAVVALTYFGYTCREKYRRGFSLSSGSGVVQQNVTSDLGGRTNGVNQQQRQTEDYAGGDHDSECDEPETNSLLSTSSAQNPSVRLQDAARPQENLQADGSEQTSIGQKAAKKSQRRRVSFQLQLHEQQNVTFRRRSKSTGDDDDDIESVLLEDQTPTQEEYNI